MLSAIFLFVGGNVLLLYVIVVLKRRTPFFLFPSNCKGWGRGRGAE